MRSMSMAQIVKTQMRKAGSLDLSDPLMGNERRLHWAAVRLGNDKTFIRWLGVQCKEMFSLGSAMGA
jgi:hypothetical protein